MRLPVLLSAFLWLISGTCFGGLLSDGLVAYYSFDGNATDESGNGNNGTVFGAVFTEDRCGANGSAIFFDGIDDHILVPHSTSLEVANDSQWSVSFWFASTKNLHYQHLFDKLSCIAGSVCGEADSRGWDVDLRPEGQINLRLDNGSPTCCTNSYNRQTTTSFNDGQWHHIAALFDATSATGFAALFVDGQLESLIHVAGNYRPNQDYNFPGPLTFGHSFLDSPDTYFEGFLDEVRLYNRTLSEAEIQALSAETACLSCVGFQAPLDAGPVTVRKNRALPLKAELFDTAGQAVSESAILALPVLQVQFDPAAGGAAVDVTDMALPLGEGTDGNQFVFTDGLWRFNLNTKNYSAVGTYTITIVSGDRTEYFIDGCSARFVIDP